MSSRDITIIILLLIVLAILYKVFQASKLQTELATKMAGKMGIVVAKPKRRQEEEEEEEEETEDTEHEEVEEEEDGQDGEKKSEEEEQEDEGKDEEIDVQEEDQNGKRIGGGKAVMLKVRKPKKSKVKIKTYDKILPFFTDTPLYARQIIEKYHEQFGKVKPNEVWVALNYTIKKGLVIKYMVSEEPKKYVYGIPEMFDGNELKPEYQSKI